MVESYFVEAFNYAAQRGKKALIICDVDEALLKTMSMQTSEHQRRLISDWYDLSGGMLYFKTGRAYQSLDQAWGRKLPGSFEHHSMMRVQENGNILHLAPMVNTEVVGRNAEKLIGNQLKIAGSAEEIWAANGREAAVFIEIKNSAVALVHSLGLPQNDTKEMRRILKSVAENVIREMGIENTHKVTAGSDAVEIVPLAPSLCSDSHRALPDSEKQRIADMGLGKATGVHNIVALYGAENVIPFMLGDSPGSDGPAMKVCEEYGGWGVGVANAKELPDEFRRVTGERIISDFQTTWMHVGSVVDHLKAQPTTVVQIHQPRLMAAQR